MRNCWAESGGFITPRSPVRVRTPPSVLSGFRAGQAACSFSSLPKAQLHRSVASAPKYLQEEEIFLSGERFSAVYTLVICGAAKPSKSINRRVPGEKPPRPARSNRRMQNEKTDSLHSGCAAGLCLSGCATSSYNRRQTAWARPAGGGQRISG